MSENVSLQRNRSASLLRTFSHSPFSMIWNIRIIIAVPLPIKNGMTYFPPWSKMMIEIGLLTKLKDFPDRGLFQNLIARISLGYHARRRKVLKFCLTTRPLGRPLRMVATNATAWCARSQEYLIPITCRIARKPDMENVPTKNPWSRFWEATWATGGNMLSSYVRSKISVKGNWSTPRNWIRSCIVRPSAPSLSGISRIPIISALRRLNTSRIAAIALA